MRRAVGFGADEIDMVIDRGAFLSGEHQKIFEDARRSGYVRVRADGSIYDLTEEIKLDKNHRLDKPIQIHQLANNVSNVDKEVLAKDNILINIDINQRKSPYSMLNLTARLHRKGCWK